MIALRFYDHKGLLEPCEVDIDTGCRRYSAGQFRQAATIKILRQLSTPLTHVREIIDNPDRAEQVIAAFADRLAADRERQDPALKHGRDTLASYDQMIEVQTRTVPSSTGWVRFWTSTWPRSMLCKELWTTASHLPGLAKVCRRRATRGIVVYRDEFSVGIGGLDDWANHTDSGQVWVSPRLIVIPSAARVQRVIDRVVRVMLPSATRASHPRILQAPAASVLR